MVCPVCFNAKQLDKGGLLPNAELAGSVQLWRVDRGPGSDNLQLLTPASSIEATHTRSGSP